MSMFHTSLKGASLLLCCYSLVCPTAFGQVAELEDTNENRLTAAAQCILPPAFSYADQLMPIGQIKVSSERAELLADEEATFKGNVEILSDSAIIQAQSARILNGGKQVIADTDVRYNDPVLSVVSDSVNIDSTANALSIANTQYQLIEFGGQGNADVIDIDQASGVSLKDVSFTTCPLSNPDWELRASEISMENGSTIGEAKHSRFYVKGVPVLYLPYFAFPLGTERQSGLLFPRPSSSSQTGIDYEQPYYWNLAPNYDLTLTPRVMSRRGFQLRSEFRYLGESTNGNINIDYLPDDTDTEENEHRYFYRFFHEQQLSDKWFLYADINGLSDSNYIIDLGSEFYNRADTHVVRTFGFDYLGDTTDISLYLRDFDIIDENTTTYRAMPEVKINGQYPLATYLELHLNSELAYFDNANESLPKAFRAHIAPTLKFPYIRQWGEFTAEATLFHTHYEQSNLGNTDADDPFLQGLEESVTRSIAQGRLFGTLHFERRGSWLSSDSKMTIEPKFQYLYTSFSEQDNIGLYDSTVLFTDVNGLFRGREFTGLDRISDNNQVTVGATSRILDSANREQFVFSIGQIFYFEDGRVSAFRSEQDRSAVASELDWRINERWLLYGDTLLSSNSQKVDRSSLTLSYRKNARNLIQLSHRYVRELSNETIDQLGVSVSWGFAKNWQWVGRVFRDMERNREIETYTGVEYESCCWAIRVVAQRYLTNRFDTMGGQTTNEYDSGISLEFSFKGLGTGNTARQMLEDGMFGYRQPYSLN